MGSGIPRLAHQGLYDSAKNDFEEGAHIHDLDPQEMEAPVRPGLEEEAQLL